MYGSRLTELVREAELRGSASAVLPSGRDELVAACRKLGELVPIMTGSAIPDTIVYSGRPEQGSWRRFVPNNAFPYHTDGAYHVLPPRWLVLYCVETEADAAITQLIDPLSRLDRTDARILMTEPWRSLNGGSRMPIRVLSMQNGGRCLRWDPMVMRPFIAHGARAGEIIRTLISTATEIQHRWSSSTLLVVDNWRMLHARPPCGDHAKRTLWRVLIR